MDCLARYLEKESLQEICSIRGCRYEFNPHEYGPLDTSNQNGLENMVSLLSFFPADMKVMSEDTEKIFESHFFL